MTLVAPIGYKDMNNSSDSNSFSMYLCMFFTLLLLKACDLTNRQFILLPSMIFKITKTFVKSGTSYEKYSYLCTANLTDTPMKQRPHIGSCQHSTHTSAQHKNAAKAQMIKSQTSERKNTQKSFIFHLFFLCLLLNLSSCSENHDYHFKNSTEALQQYRDFHHSIAAVHNIHAEKLADFICQWQELSDTVYSFIQKDPAFTSHASLSMFFQDTSDSVRIELFRLAEDCSLSDVAYVRMHTSPYRNDVQLDSTRRNAAAFFTAMDRQAISNKGNARERVALYRSFLADTQGQGIHSHQELLSFLQTEDRHFRSFLSHIGDYPGVGLEDITKMTRQICADIYRSASENRLPSEDAMVYMGMRSCRRLLLNAQVCADLIKEGKVDSESQANAYLWMSLQPFLSMDAFAISLLTEAQQQQMTELARSYPEISERLAKNEYADPERLARIPEQLMRLYIATL